MRRSISASRPIHFSRSTRTARALRCAELARLLAATRIGAIESALTSERHALPAADARVVSAVPAMRHTHGILSLDALCGTLGCSMRSLQRLFARQVGISPKLLGRIFRFQRVFSAWRDDPSSLSRVAAECGYADQSHLTRDFRVFAGRAPAAFLATQPEITQFFLSAHPQRAER